MKRLAGLVAGLALTLLAGPGAALDLEREAGSIRVATFNAALSRKGAGLLIRDIAEPDEQVLAVAEIILRARPDVLLLNEFDHDHQGRALELFAALLAEGVGAVPGIDYPHRYAGPVNTGEPSGHDLDGDGRRANPDDAFGYGEFPGQAGMALLSRLPIALDRVRPFGCSAGPICRTPTGRRSMAGPTTTTRCGGRSGCRRGVTGTCRCACRRAACCMSWPHMRRHRSSTGLRTRTGAGTPTRSACLSA